MKVLPIPDHYFTVSPCHQRKLSARSDRVKCVDVHPTEPWMLASLYNGNVHVWNYESQTLVKTFEVTDLPGKIKVALSQ